MLYVDRASVFGDGFSWLALVEHEVVERGHSSLVFFNAHGVNSEIRNSLPHGVEKPRVDQVRVIRSKVVGSGRSRSASGNTDVEAGAHHGVERRRSTGTTPIRYRAGRISAARPDTGRSCSSADRRPGSIGRLLPRDHWSASVRADSRRRYPRRARHRSASRPTSREGRHQACDTRRGRTGCTTLRSCCRTAPRLGGWLRISRKRESAWGWRITSLASRST